MRTIDPTLRFALTELVATKKSGPAAKRQKHDFAPAAKRLRCILSNQVVIPQVAAGGVRLHDADGRQALLKCSNPANVVNVWTMLNAWRPLVAEILKIGTVAEDVDDAVTRMHKCLYADETRKFRLMVAALSDAVSAFQ